MLNGSAPLFSWLRRFCVAGAWLGLAGLAVASSGSSRFAVKVKETEDGLPQSSVIAMTQTRDGYLWLGTLEGLVRYDGFTFRVFDENNTPGLTSRRIVHLFEDSRRTLWIGTENKGIVMLKDGQFVSPPNLALGGIERRLVSACEDTAGGVWLASANGEIWRYDGDRFISFLLMPIASSNRRIIMAEQSGVVWVGTDTRQCAVGPMSKQPELGLPIAYELSAARLDYLLVSRRGGYWRLADGTIQRWLSTNRLSEPDISYPWGQAKVTTACEDQYGNLIVGTESGVFWFDERGGSTRLSTEEDLSNNYVLSLVMDREGTLWVGTDGGGLNRVKRKAFDSLSAVRGWVVQSVAEDAEGGLWIASNDNGVGRWYQGKLTPGHGSFRSKSVRSVLVDRSRDIFLGTRLSGLLWQQNGVFVPVQSPVTIDPVVNVIHQSSSGMLSFGTEAGLVQWDRNRWSLVSTTNGLSADAITAVAEDPRSGALWVGTRAGGLNYLRDGKVTVYRKKEHEMPADDVSALEMDEQGILWIGTGSGLVRLKDSQWTLYTTAEGLTSESVAYLLDDDRGNLWVGSNKGLMQIAKRELNEFAEGRTSFIPARVYRREDGLPSSECTPGSQPAATRTRDGRLWFPTIEGLVSVNPEELRTNTNPPPVIIESVLIEGGPEHSWSLTPLPDQTITVPANRQRDRVEIQYASLNLGAPERARFRYRLEGHETDWTTQAGDVRSVRYNKLPPGTYRFHVKACNEDGVWNEVGASVGLTVLPPYWATWWFRTLAAVVILGLVAALVFYISTQRLQRQLATMRQQELLEKERARIARDIHDQLGASLTQLALLGELAEADKDSPADVQTHARQICQSARETTRTLDEIVWTVNPSNDTLEGVVNYVCKYAQEYLAVAGLRYRLEVPSELPDASIAPEVRHNVFLAAKEAVTNIVRHARASSAWMRLHLASDRFTLELEDDGKGAAAMDAKRAATRNGLTNMRKRMEDVGGAFEFIQGPEGGTIVRLTAPLRPMPAERKDKIDSQGKAG